MSINLDVGIHILREEKCVGEEVRKAEARHHVGSHVAAMVGDEALDEREHGAAHNHRHEEAAGGGGVLAKPLHREVERAGPHDRGAKAAEHEQERRQRHLLQGEDGGHAREVACEHRHHHVDLRQHHAKSDQQKRAAGRADEALDRKCVRRLERLVGAGHLERASVVAAAFPRGRPSGEAHRGAVPP